MREFSIHFFDYTKHNNPIVDEIVYPFSEYLFDSPRDNVGVKGLVNTKLAD